MSTNHKTLALALTALVAAGCVLTSRVIAQTPLVPLRIAGNMTTIELSPVLVAADSLYKGPITVINGGIPNLVAGEVDAATNAETQALRQSVDDPSLRIIFTVSEGVYRLVARKSAGIRTAADLKGKRIATARNTSSHYYVVKLLKTVNLTESDVTIVPINPLSGMSEALKNRTVDAVSIWEPEGQHSADTLGDDLVILQPKDLYRELFNLNTSAKVLADPAKRRALVELLRTLIVASEKLRSQPKPYWPLIESKLKYSEPVLEKSWEHHRFAGSMVKDLLDVMTEEEVWVAKERGRTPRSRAQLATLIDGSLLREAVGGR